MAQVARNSCRPSLRDAARKAAEARYNIVHFTTMPHGGHFPAFEQPTLWVDDIRTFFREQR